MSEFLAVIAIVSALAAAPYPPGYTLADHAAEYGFDLRTWSYATQAGYTAARLRWDPSGRSLSTGVEVGFVKDQP